MASKKKKKSGDGGGEEQPSWMVSYADMATVLLALFIALSSMAKDQTGLAFYYGTGSFRNALKSFNLPGLSDRETRNVPLSLPGPMFSADNPEPEAEEAKPGDRILDAEEEHFQNFLNDVKAAHPVAKLPGQLGEAAVDFHGPLAEESPRLSKKQRDMASKLLGFLDQPGYTVEIVVWSPTPYNSALLRSAGYAREIRQELLEWTAMPDSDAGGSRR